MQAAETACPRPWPGIQRVLRAGPHQRHRRV